jgi:hypothetical protein
MAEDHPDRFKEFREAVSQLGPTVCTVTQLAIQVWLIVVHRGPLSG